MPQFARITATFFTNLINRLGIRPPFDEGYILTNVVQPVSLVDTDISIPTTLTRVVLDVPFTAGETAAPGINVVLADTGALPAGDYNCRIMLGSDASSATTVDLRIQRRNAANAANIWVHRFALQQTAQNFYDIELTVTLVASERIRVITAAATVGNTVTANIWASLKTT